MPEAELIEALSALRPGEDVTVVDVMGARMSGVVMKRRPGIDPADELGIRRRHGGVPHWVPFDRIVALERG